VPFRYGRDRTLGETAAALLDDIHNLAIGKPGPEIDGIELNGKPLKLSDQRGKVTLLVFWSTWCGPCMAAIPEERKLHEQFKDQRFAMLGVNCDSDLDQARQAVKEHKIAWPNWVDPLTEEGEGPIRYRYHVHGIPRTFLLDADGMIRGRDLRGAELVEQVAALLEELKSRQ
jgi:thiol-disulfide isomerase/thioredoxin